MPIQGGELLVSPPVLTLRASDPSARQPVQIKLINDSGLNVRGAAVSVRVRQDDDRTPWMALVVGLAPVGKVIPWAVDADGKAASVTVRTGDDGSVGLLIGPDPDHLSQLPDGGIVKLLFSTTLGRFPQEFLLPVKVAMAVGKPQ